jgi:enoyl-CoA hydratase/carnithine racemase
MEMIQLEYDDGVALVKLNRSVTNALNLPLVDELAGILQGLEHDSDVRSLVLCSSNDKFFSIGFDIPHLFKLAQEDFETFYQAFNRACMHLYTLPKPTVAAITGHAIAGGCILALCCDYRFIADGRKLMGLNEIKLGVPVPYLADCILRHLVGTRHAREIMDAGEFYPPEESFHLGLVDQVFPLEQVLPRAVEKARSLGASPEEAFAMIKQNRVEMVRAQILARLEDRTAYFIEHWYSAQARERLTEAMKRF